jgi:hypothetical protein
MPLQKFIVVSRENTELFIDGVGRHSEGEDSWDEGNEPTHAQRKKQYVAEERGCLRNLRAKRNPDLGLTAVLLAHDKASIILYTGDWEPSKGAIIFPCF